MRKLLTLMALLCLIGTMLLASGSNDPNDDIYDDIDKWHNIGLIDNLPPVRPYPTQYLLKILGEVAESSNEDEALKAREYIESYTKTSVAIELRSNNFTSFDEAQTITGVSADVNLYLKDSVTAGLDISGYVLNDTDDAVTDPITPTGISLNDDNMGFSAFGEYWNIYQGLDVNAAFGSDTLWLQTGLMNTSFGPLFDDSVVVSPDAVQSAHFSATWIEDRFTVSYLFMPIVATDSEGENASDDKYLHIHSLDVPITSWWDFQFYESVVYGGEGVKPIFFLPFSEFFYSASVGETWDVNSLMGLSSRFQLPNNMSLTGNVYVDDLAAKDILELNFDTRYKLAAQGEYEWEIADSLLRNITFSYTAIMPYMYTHTTEADEDNEYFDLFGTDYDIRSYALYTDMNYENYTNNGLTMGPYGMEPNSDKFGLTFKFDAPKEFKVTLSTFLQRHGNSSSDSDRDYDEEDIDWEYFYDNYDSSDADDDYTWDTSASTSFDESTYDYDTYVASSADLNNFYSVFDTDQDSVIDDAVDTDGTIFDTGYGWTDAYLYDHDTPFLSQDILEYLFVAKLSVQTPEVNFLGGEIYGTAGYTFVHIINQDLVEDDTYTGNYVSLAFNYRF